MVIFGATGDLMRSKLLPSLFNLFKEGKIGEKFYIIGFSRRNLTNEEFRKYLYEQGKINRTNKSKWQKFIQNFYYQQGFFDEQKGYRDLIKTLERIDKENGACITRFYYLATPPQHYSEILNFLSLTKLSEGCGQNGTQWTRLIIEKPFGKDLETAKALDNKLSEIFEEHQIFRVDHYLSKETVQNMIVFRFANGIFEPIWNKNYINNVQITWAEKRGVTIHTEFFDSVGLLRDIAQNHLMQLIAAVAMDQPTSFTKQALRDVRAKAISQIHQMTQEEIKQNVVRGQYEGYREGKNISKNSNTETFVAMKIFVDNDRFVNVPFYIRAGKELPKDMVEISIVFNQKCHLLFKEFGCPEEGNVLKIRIQPNEGIGIRIILKKPGSKLSLETADMKFSYSDVFGRKKMEAYEKVLLDIFAGDQTLFNRSDELASSWDFITRILKVWEEEEKLGKKISLYKPGTWGPNEAFDLIQKDLKKWQ